MAAETLSSAVIDHPLITDISQSKPDLRRLGYIFFQYGFYCEQFPALLRLITERFASREEVQVVQRNLAEELGDGDAAKAHTTMYQKFLADLAKVLPPKDREEFGFQGEAVTRYIAELNRFLSTAELFESLGAVGPGTEEITPRQYSQIFAGLKGYEKLNGCDTKFFSVHISVDAEHSAEIWRCFNRFAKTDSDRRAFFRGTELALALEKQFWDELLLESGSVVN